MQRRADVRRGWAGRQSPGVTRLPTHRRRASLVGTASFRLELAGCVSGRRGTDRVVRHRSGQILVGQARPGGAGRAQCVTEQLA